jgi:hypothetical protein
MTVDDVRRVEKPVTVDAQTTGTATMRDLDAIIGRLGDLAPSGWAAPVRCEGWDVTALAVHRCARGRPPRADFGGLPPLNCVFVRLVGAEGLEPPTASL